MLKKIKFSQTYGHDAKKYEQIWNFLSLMDYMGSIGIFKIDLVIA